MHIKRNTQGSSNEISFSVLDAAREAMEEDRRGANSSAGGVSLFTLGKGKKPRATPTKDQHIVLSSDIPRSCGTQRGASTLASSSMSHVGRSFIKGVPVLVGLCVVLVLLLVGLQTWMQISAGQQTLRGQLSEQIDLIKQADTVVIPLDDLVMKASSDKLFAEGSDADPTLSSEALSEDYREVVSNIPTAQTDLKSVVSSVEGLQASLSGNEDEEAASQAITAAQSRLNMLDAGVKVVDLAQMATGAFEKASQGWNEVINGDASVRQATALLEDMTKKNVQASMEESHRAIHSFQEAKDLMSQAQSAYPGLNFEEVTSYLDTRLAAQQAALEANQAYLDRDKKALKKKNDQYNRLEDEAASIAQSLGDTPAQQVVAKFQESLPKLKDAYEAERLKAGNADAFLRDYLGRSA